MAHDSISFHVMIVSQVVTVVDLGSDRDEPDREVDMTIASDVDWGTLDELRETVVWSDDDDVPPPWAAAAEREQVDRVDT